MKVNLKREELKNDGLRTEMHQGVKARQCPKRTAAVEAGSKILGQALIEKWIPPKKGHFGGGRNFANVREHSFLIRINEQVHSRTSNIKEINTPQFQASW